MTIRTASTFGGSGGDNGGGEPRDAQPILARAQGLALLIGVAALLLWALVGGLFQQDQLFRSYLVAYLFVAGLSLGSVVMLMLHNLTGGAWGLMVRRSLEAGARTVPLLIVLFIPILIGMPRLYQWVRDPSILGPNKAHYLAVGWWIGRAAAYLLVWVLLSLICGAWARQTPTTDNPYRTGLQRFSGAGMLLWSLAVTFAAIDWSMSAHANWHSTVYGMLFMVDFSLTATVFVTALAALLARYRPFSDFVTAVGFNDLGNLVITQVVLWAYLSFAQFLVIWMGNLPAEVTWYLPRTHRGWYAIAMGLIGLHFFVPFMLLLHRTMKRNPLRLAWICLLLLVMRFVDMLWVIVPSFNFAGWAFSWLYAVAPVGLLGIWLGVFLWTYRRGELVTAYATPAEVGGEYEHG